MISICFSATALVQPAAFPSHSVASRGAVLRAPAPIAAEVDLKEVLNKWDNDCLLYTSPSPRDRG